MELESQLKKTKTGQREKNLKLNLLVFNADKNPFTIAFFKEDERSNKAGRHQLNDRHWPSEYKNEDGIDYLYTDFTDHEDAEIRVEVNPETTNPLFLKALYQNRVLNYIRNEFPKLIINKDFISNPEVWMVAHADDQPGGGVKRFRKYGLKMSVGSYTNKNPELLISYRGFTDVIGKNLSHFQENLDDITHVVNKVPEVKRYKKVIELGGHDLRQYYPVVNNDLQEKYALPDNYHYVENKYEDASKKISAFYSTIFEKAAFSEMTGLIPKGFFRPLKKDIGRVDMKHHRLIFGGGKTDQDAFEGMKSFGPWRSSSAQNPRILLIAPEGKEFIVLNKLIMPFLKGDGYYPGASTVTNLPLRLIDGAITYNDYQNPHNEVIQQLKERNIQSNNDVIAFFCSSIAPDAPVALKRRFYQVKNSLLNRGIQMQGINMMKLEMTRKKDVSWWHQHLCAAVLAKLGGIPWKSGSKDENELIIGVGAFNPYWSPGRFVGSSCCFDSSGIFRGYDFFDHENTRLLAGSIKKALKHYIQEKEEPGRVIIHYYKDMEYELQKPIWRAINELQPGVPVYVVSINSTREHDEVLLDKHSKKRIPLSGTYFHMQRNQYLLFNNTRFTKGKDPKKCPFPVKLKIREIWSDEKREKVREMPEEERRKAMEVPEGVVQDLMSQIVRFSRMYWRSTKPQPLPATIAYPMMLAGQVPYFKNAKIPHRTKHLPFFL